MNQTERALAGVSMGDDESIRALAARLDAVTPEAVANLAADRLRFQAAAQQFQKTYSDVWSDEVLRKEAIYRDKKLADAEPGLDYTVRLTRVGDEIRDWQKRQTAGKAAPAASEQAARRPRRVAEQVIDDPDDGDDNESPAAVSRIIRRMAQSRGQRDATYHPFHEHDQRWPDER